MNKTTETPKAQPLFLTCSCGATYFRMNGHTCGAPDPKVFDLVGYLNKEAK